MSERIPVNKPEKPSAGSWTQLYNLGTDDVSYVDSISPEIYEKEKEAIFRRTWLNIGRVEQVEKPGAYFTKELEFLNTSVLVARGNDNEVRAFHNICSHRGNKLVWDEHPKNEVKGTTRQFACKYHAWRYDLNGDLIVVAREEEFFDLDKCKYGLSKIHTSVWNGFIFINLADEPEQSLDEYLGEFGRDLADYPFHAMTEVYALRSVINSNWKEFLDSFAEIYHAPFLHNDMSPEMAEGIATADAPLFKVSDPHRMVSWRNIPVDVELATGMEKATKSGLFGPYEKADIGMDDNNLPKGINPLRDPHWGLDSYQLFPNMFILPWERNWYLTYHWWPLGVDKHLFEVRMYFVPAKNAEERVRNEFVATTTREYALQDANTLEATHSMLKAGVKTEFPLCDQEVLLRHLHKMIKQYIDDYDRKQAASA